MLRYILTMLFILLISHSTCIISKDVPFNNQIHPAILALANEGIIQISEESSFVLNKQVTNHEAYDLIKKAFGDSGLNTDNHQTQNRKWISENIYPRLEEPALMQDVCNMLLRAKNLPILQSTLYERNEDNAVFSAFVYNYIDKTYAPSEAATYELLLQMIYRAKDINPSPKIPNPKIRSGVKTSSSGYDSRIAIEKIQEAEVSLLAIPDHLRKHFTEHGYCTTLMPEDAYEEKWRVQWGYYTNSTACYSYEGKYILSTLTDLWTLSHEFGHHLYYWFATEEEYAEIYQREIAQICQIAGRSYDMTNQTN